MTEVWNSEERFGGAEIWEWKGDQEKRKGEVLEQCVVILSREHNQSRP